MLVNLLYGLPTMAVCLLLQTFLVVFALRYYARRERSINARTFGSAVLVINGVMLTLIIGNIAQVLIWALLFMFVGEFSDWNTAV